jgi:hypothetical protein
MGLLRPNVHYFGIDIALPRRQPNLLEIDILQYPVTFNDRRFDIVVAQGLFEYMAEQQDEKLSEISAILMPNGRFVTSYVNFAHRRRDFYIYNNVQPLSEFRGCLEKHFTVERSFPTSHNWRHNEPERPLLQQMNMGFNLNVPYLSPLLAVEYLFVCKPLT